MAAFELEENGQAQLLVDEGVPDRLGVLRLGWVGRGCGRPGQPGRVEGGVLSVALDEGHGTASALSTASILNGTPSVTGRKSPLVLDYTVDMSQVPPQARVVRVFVQYDLSGSDPFQDMTVTDPGGSVTSDIGPWHRDWAAAGVAAANTALRDAAFTVRAECSFAVSSIIDVTFSVTSFEVWWTDPVP